MPKSQIKINYEAIKQNCLKLKELNPQTLIGACLKAKAYSHNLLKTAKTLHETVDYYLVGTANEAVKLADKFPNKPILILYTFNQKDLSKICNYPNIELSIYSTKVLEQVISFSKSFNNSFKIHLNIDTGMHCLGLDYDQKTLEQVIKMLKHSQKINLTGVYTHLATADEEDTSYYYEQLENFKNSLRFLEANGLKPKLIHYQNTAGFIRQDALDIKDLDVLNYQNMARLGIGIYGYYPSSQIEAIAIKNKLKKLTPSLVWYAYIDNIKQLKKGNSISYGQAFICSQETTIATIPIGYSDGFARRLSNVGQVMIKGQIFQVIGRVRMNMIAIDITKANNPIKIGQKVDLINSQITADKLATIGETINYEILTNLK